MQIYFLINKLLFIFIEFYKAIKADEYEYKLIRDLLEDYNLYARPSYSYKEPLNVTFGLSLSQLIDVDEKNQIITTNCWITMYWSDYKLRWNESEYGGLREIRLPHDRIWKPDVILYNNADGLASLSQISTHMMIESNGNVTWLSTSIFKSSCSINVQHFPFDKQNCSLSFASWTYDGNGINLLKNSDTGDISNYINNGEWTLESLLVERNIKIYSCCPVPYPNVTYYIVMKRRPLFYVFNMILPSMLITFVGFLGFLIPPDSGEKVSMGVTTLLSMTVFLMVVAENMPPNSDSVPLIATYYFGSMLIISLATAGTVFTLNTSKKGEEEEPVPEILQKIFFDVVAKILFIRIKVNRKIKLSVSDVFPKRYINHVNMLTEKRFNDRCALNVNDLNENCIRFNRRKSKSLNKPKVERGLKNFHGSDSDLFHVTSDPLPNRILLRASPLIHTTTKFNHNARQFKENSRTNNKKSSNSNELSTTTINTFNENYLTLGNQSFETSNDEFNDNPQTSIKRKSKFNNDKQSNQNSINLALKSTEIICPHSNKKHNRQHDDNTNMLFSSGVTNLKLASDPLFEHKNLAKLIKNLNDNLEKNDLKDIIEEYREEIRNQWIQLAKVIDILFAYGFVLATLIMFALLVNQAPNVTFS